MDPMAEFKTGKAFTEGDELYFEVRGQGRALLMIPGALGDAGVYEFAAGILSGEFKVITYDRRGQSRSTRREPQNYQVSQQARDAVAVMRAAGEERAIVFGSSAGAQIGLEVARSFPQAVQALIAHEPPALRVLPDADKWLGAIARIYLTALEAGAKKAQAEFMAMLAIPPTMPEPELEGATVYLDIDERQRASASAEFGIRHEMMPTCQYMADVDEIKGNGTRVIMAVGKLTRELGSFYGRTVPILAERLGSDVVILPGHHGSYMVTPWEWSTGLREILRGI
jgi:pimeloyl-ACP methyl ester carboxylesterase